METIDFLIKLHWGGNSGICWACQMPWQHFPVLLAF